MKTYIEPACEVIVMDLKMIICASFDSVDNTELFAIEDIELL
jgi:hypothetical protein